MREPRAFSNSSITCRLYSSDKARRQLDSVFTINKADCEKAYRREANELKAFEDERRANLRQRDSIVTEVYSNER